MKTRTTLSIVFNSITAALIIGAALTPSARAGTGAGARATAGARGAQAPAIISPEVSPDRKVTFRVAAPQAQSVRLTGADSYAFGRNTTFTKGSNNVWELTIGPVDPGAYRYTLNIDGATVIDQRNTATSESNEYLASLFNVPGLDFMDAKDVPHGAISEVTYYSKTLQRLRRMHVYTPPGYELGKSKYPAFYLLHGMSDCDDSWSTVGRAGVILDNLLAAKKAKPMIMVMPAGHTGPNSARGGSLTGAARDEFVEDFMNDIMPYIETHYRVSTDRADRAVAGLSMGGAQTLNIGIPHLDQFAYIGVFSSGVFEFRQGRGAQPAATNAPGWEERNKAMLDNPKLKKGTKLIWFATGKEDSLISTSQTTVEVLKKHGFNVTYKETEGAHTWTNWRNYLHEFAPLLFQ